MSATANRADGPGTLHAGAPEPPALRPEAARRDVTWEVLSERINDLIIVADIEGRVFYASPAARNLGYEPHELNGLIGADLVHPDDLARFTANSAGLFAPQGIDRHADREHRFRRKDGSWVWLEGSPTILPGPGGRPVGILNVFRDVSERRASREALWEQARRASMAEAVAGVGYWRLDADTLEISWSEQVFRMFGRALGDEPGLAVALAMVHPDDAAASRARLEQQLRTGEAFSGTTTRILRPGGETRYLSGHSICETDGAGRVTAVFGTLIDVTEQETLKVQVQAALAAAEQAVAVKAEFLANMSHEIRTPLTAILGFASLLSERRDFDPVAQGQIGRIARAGRALLAVVNDVLDFSKLEAGEVTIRRRPACAEQAAREVLEMFAGQAGAKGLDLRFEACVGLPPSLVLDEDRLRQILINLVGNAVKFTDRGRVSLALSYDAQDRLVADVADTGPGIAAGAKVKLFQRFSQIDGSSTRTKGGSGLGLAICQGLAQAMGGAVSVTSRVGRGSTFRLVLPAARGVADDTVGFAAECLDRLCGVRVLVVDDNAANRELARAILEPVGVEVSEARGGREAVEAARGLPFDAILMDLRMPDLDGRTATAAIRREPGPNQHMPILAFSADGAMDLGAAENAGFQGVVRKPMAPVDLLQALLRAMGDGLTEDGLAEEGPAIEEGTSYASAS